MVPEIFQFYQGGFFCSTISTLCHIDSRSKYDTDSTEALCGNTEKGGKKEYLCAVVVNGWLSHNTGWRATPKMTLKNECFAQKQVLNMSKSEIF